MRKSDYKFQTPCRINPVGRLCVLAVVAVIALTALPRLVWAQAPKPDGPLAIILIRDALTALNQANWTGNYTVMRDYASPKFASANDPVRLTAIFQPIRAEALNLAPILYLTPKITVADLTDNGTRLQLKGYFDNTPKQIHFDLIFEPIAKRWRLFGIGVWSVVPKQPVLINALPPIDGSAPVSGGQSGVPTPRP